MHILRQLPTQVAPLDAASRPLVHRRARRDAAQLELHAAPAKHGASFSKGEGLIVRDRFLELDAAEREAIYRFLRGL